MSFNPLLSKLEAAAPEVPWEMKRKGDVWQFWAENVSAVGSEMYPWDERVVKAIREFEPDFCPLWVTTTYRSPAGTFEVFGRHAIGIDCKNHFQEGSHPPVKVWGAAYGVNAGRRPILVESILQDEKVQVIPDLKVFGYKPLDWGTYYELKGGWYATKKAKDESRNDADKEAADYIRAKEASDAKEKKAMDEEADYRFDFVSNKGKKIRDEILGMTHEQYRALGIAR